MGMKFKLIGRATVFVADRIYRHAGFIPSVHGVTGNGKLETTARLNDVEWIAE